MGIWTGVLATLRSCKNPVGFVTAVYRFSLLLPVVVLLAACLPEPEPRLRIATNQWLGYEPLYFARDMGYFAPTPIQFIELPNASAVINAFRNQAIDMAALTLDEALLLKHDGIDVRIVLVLDISLGADALVARPGIRNLAELKGARVGVESGALGAYMLGRSLEKAGLKPSDVRIVPVTAEKHAQAYLSGNVDAIVTFEPMRTHLLNAGGRVIFDSSDIPNEIVDVLVINGRAFESRQDDLENIINAWFRAVNYIAANHEEAAKRISGQLGMTGKEVTLGMSQIRWADQGLNRLLLTGDKPGLYESAGRMSEIMVQHKLISRPVVISSLIDSRQVELLE